MYRSFPHLLTILALLFVCGESAAQNTASSDADLSGLTLSAGTLAPAFDPATASRIFRHFWA